MNGLSPYARRGSAVRITYLGLAILCWVVTGFGRLSARRTVVLCYHSVPDDQQAAFRWQLERMAKRLVSTTAIAEARSGRLGPPRVAATFDDAFECLRENGLEPAADRRLPLTIYAVSSCLGRTPDWDIAPEHPEASMRTMTADELLQANAQAGVTIGSHTARHPRLSELSNAELRDELAQSKQALEELLGAGVAELALPHGAWNDTVVTEAREAGYTRVFTLEPRMAPSDLPPGVFGRFLMTPDAWRLEFLLTIDGAYRWLPLVRRLRRRSAKSRAAAAMVGSHGDD